MVAGLAKKDVNYYRRIGGEMKQVLKNIGLFILIGLLGVIAGMVMSDLVNAWVGDRISGSLEAVRVVDQVRDTIFWEMTEEDAWAEYQTLKANGIQVRWEVEQGKYNMLKGAMNE